LERKDRKKEIEAVFGSKNGQKEY